MADLTDAIRHFRSVPDNLLKALKESFVEVGELITSDAKSNCPVDTGFLRDSIKSNVKVENDDVLCEVVATAEYASFIELGTSRMVAQPFIRPAIESNKDKINELIKKSVKRAFT